MSSAPTSHRTFRVLAVGPRVQGVPIVPGRVRPGPFQITNLQKKTPDGAPLDSPAASPSESHRGGHKQGLIREEAGQLRSHHIHRPSRRFTPPPRGGGEGINCGPKWHTGFCPRVSGGPPLAIPGKSLGGGGGGGRHTNVKDGDGIREAYGAGKPWAHTRRWTAGRRLRPLRAGHKRTSSGVSSASSSVAPPSHVTTALCVSFTYRTSCHRWCLPEGPGGKARGPPGWDNLKQHWTGGSTRLLENSGHDFFL